MELTIRNRYHKDGRKMSPDFRPKSIPELEEVLNRVESRLYHEQFQKQNLPKQEST